jgi:pimeloyl-ACP methyl ester carboxylesterase
MTITTSDSGLIDIRTTHLYYEVIGHGPTLLLISGGGGDAALWSKVGPQLARDFMVVTYDRRGYSRSPRPANWTTTTVNEQADDAAALLRRLELVPAMTVGHSSGASIACDLAARHGDVVRHAVIYEPPLLAVLPDGERVLGGMRALIEQAMADGGPRRAMEVFMRANAGDTAFERWQSTVEPALRERMMDNASVFFEIELPAMISFIPDCAALRAAGIPLTVVVGTDNRGTWFDNAAAWLVANTGAQRVYLPGGHAGFDSHPDALVDLVQSLAR